jgi:hypothetical protein
MSRYIIHPGTGTIIDIDDGCWFIDTDALPDEVDIEELASTSIEDLPEDIPASHRLGFDYAISDLRNDLADGYVVDEKFREYIESLPYSEVQFILSNTLELTLIDDSFWDVWYNNLNSALRLSKVATDNKGQEEPF